MPRKTRRQKILSDRRRNISLKQSLQESSNIAEEIKDTDRTHQKKAPSYVFSTFNKSQNQKIKTLNTKDYSHVKNDILKMVIFTFLAIGSQVVLYFLLQG